MKTLLAAFLVLPAFALRAGAAEPPAATSFPQPPSAQTVMQLLHLEASKPVVTVDAPPIDKTKEEKIIWDASYRVQTTPPFFLHITLVHAGMIKTQGMEDVAHYPELEFQKITKNNGDVIYHFLGDRTEHGTLYSTNLINHQKDWDLMIVLGTESNSDEKKLPIRLGKDGIAFIEKLNGELRKE